MIRCCELYVCVVLRGGWKGGGGVCLGSGGLRRAAAHVCLYITIYRNFSEMLLKLCRPLSILPGNVILVITHCMAFL